MAPKKNAPKYSTTAASWSSSATPVHAHERARHCRAFLGLNGDQRRFSASRTGRRPNTRRGSSATGTSRSSAAGLTVTVASEGQDVHQPSLSAAGDLPRLREGVRKAVRRGARGKAPRELPRTPSHGDCVINPQRPTQAITGEQQAELPKPRAFV